MLTCPLIRFLHWHRLKIVAGDPQLPHHGVQGRAWHPETGGCSADHATGLPENADDIFAFHFRERATGGQRRRRLFGAFRRSV